MVPDAMVLVDQGGVIRLVNDAAVEMFGHARDQFVGRTLDLLMPPATVERHAEHVRAFIASPRRRMMGKFRPLTARRRDGVELPVEIALNQVTVGTEELAAATIRDVTSQRASERSAVERETQLRSIIEMARVGTWALDLEAGSAELSESFLALLGLRSGVSSDELLARVHPDDVAVWRETKLNAERAGGPVRAQLRLLHSDGSWRTMDTRCSIRRAPGEAAKLVGLSIDITERLRVEALERDARDRLVTAERMATVGLLAAGLAHEINNPLTAVLSNLFVAMDELARHQGGDATGQRLDCAGLLEALGDARESAVRVRDIVRDLKIFSRHDEVGNTAIDVRRVVESSLRMARNEIRHRAQLVTRFDEVPPVDATEARLGQVVLNLLLNAAQAIPPGNANANEIQVSVGPRAPERVVIEVRDSGPGIPKEHFGRLFTPFFTTKPKGEGTGLGLSICHRIVTDLHGQMEAENAPDRGAVFRIVLPAAAGAVAQDAMPFSRATPRPVRRGRVLVVDDDATVARSTRRALEALHDVTVATSAADALAALSASEDFDVILCDVMMPEVGGLSCFRELTRLSPALAERVVFVTGGAFTEEARLFLAHTRNRVIEKPFRPADLRSLVNQMVR